MGKKMKKWQLNPLEAVINPMCIPICPVLVGEYHYKE